MAAETKAVARLTSIKYINTCTSFTCTRQFLKEMKTKIKIHKKGNVQSDALVLGNAFLHLPCIRKSIKKPKSV